MRRALIIAMLAVGLIVESASPAPAVARRILDRDRASGGQTAVAKAWSRNWPTVGFAVGTRDADAIGFYWKIACRTGWSRWRRGTVSLGSGEGRTWILHPPQRTRCNETLKAWLLDETGVVVAIIAVQDP